MPFLVSRNRWHGATPPNVYISNCGKSFSMGFVRLIPQNERKVFGRDSNGCVSIRNYDAFLQAYLDHKIKRLAVVASL
jgi:hypothetical protein